MRGPRSPHRHQKISDGLHRCVTTALTEGPATNTAICPHPGIQLLGYADRVPYSGRSGLATRTRRGLICLQMHLDLGMTL